VTDEVFIKNTEQLPTKELLRAQRKKAYEAAKQKRREDRKAEKMTKQLEKKQAQAARDKQLWSSLKPASSLKTDETI